jgi:predicted aconitase with swiveling domain
MPFPVHKPHIVVKGRSISNGIGKGEVLMTKDPISFLGGVDPKTGIILDKENSAFGKSVAGKVLVFPRGKGSTVGSYVMLQLKKNGVAPAAIINLEAETIVAIGAIISGIPLVDRLEKDPYSVLKDGKAVVVDGNNGTLEIK